MQVPVMVGFIVSSVDSKTRQVHKILQKLEKYNLNQISRAELKARKSPEKFCVTICFVCAKWLTIIHANKPTIFENIEEFILFDNESNC
jgi:hypothetical protein